MKTLLKKLARFIHNRPVISFVLLLVILLIVIVAGDRLRAPEDTSQDTREVSKDVEMFSFSDSPRFKVAGVVEDEGVITLTSQVSAIVSRVSVSAGNDVVRGKTLVNLSDTYLGGSSAGKQLNIAERNAELQDEIAKRQLDINERNYDEAPKTDDDEDKNLRAELKVQEFNALLNEDVTQLQEEQARIAASAYYPASPLAGKVERVHVAPGERVSPGMPLVTVSGTGDITATVLIPRRIAALIDVDAPHFAEIGAEQYQITPQYLSQTSTNGQNYSLVFVLDESLRERLSDQGFLTISIALKNGGENINAPLIPVDAVFMTSERSFVFVEVDGRAASREVTTGEVIGRYVEVLDGLTTQDRVIVSRNVGEGDTVRSNDQ